jgi:hypothetical protein
VAPTATNPSIAVLTSTMNTSLQGEGGVIITQL